MISDIDLSSSKDATFNWINMTQHSFVDLENIFKTDVGVPKIEIKISDEQRVSSNNLT